MRKLAKMMLCCCMFAVGAVGFSARAGSPVRFGVKAGMTINELKFNENAFDSDNRSGFTGGVMMQFVAPIINIGFDASLMYTHRSTKVMADFGDPEDNSTVNIGRDYIELPINFRWNIGLPLVGKFVTPFLTTGPDFSFLISSKNVKDAWNNRTFDFAWNFGFGLKIVNKVELAASYGLGINNSASGDTSLYGPVGVDAKNRFWTVTAAWLF